jgi:hypothetical protein
VSVLQTAVYSGDYRTPSWRKTLRNIAGYLTPFLHSFLSVAHIIVDVLIFTVILWPWFDQLTASLGHNVRFAAVYEHLLRLDIRQAFAVIRDLVVGS